MPGVTSAVSADGGRVHFQVRSSKAAGTAEVQQPAALCRDHPRGAQIHDGGEALSRSPASCIRMMSTAKTCSMALRPAARGHEGRARLGHELQARRQRFQRPGRASMKADGCDLVVLGTIIRETIGAMSEAKKLGWDVDFPRRHADQRAGSTGTRQGCRRGTLRGRRFRNSL